MINKNFTTPSGKSVTVSVGITNSEVSGTAVVNGSTYDIIGCAVVQGRKVLQLKNAPYLPIDNALYKEIDETARHQYQSNMSPLAIAEGRMREAEAKYNRLTRSGHDNVAILSARDEWDRLSDEYHRLSK